MSKIPWGKPRIFTKNADNANAKAYEHPTPVEDSTQLTPTKGDKMEAKIEGGQNEDVKYKRSTYEVAYNIRKATGRKSPYPATDGLVNDHYGIMLMPEDDNCEGFYIESSTVGVDDTYTAADGAIWEIHHDAVQAAVGDTVKWGTVKVAAGGGSVTFTERSSDDDTTSHTPFSVTWQLDNDSE